MIACQLNFFCGGGVGSEVAMMIVRYGFVEMKCYTGPRLNGGVQCVYVYVCSPPRCALWEEIQSQQHFFEQLL